MKGSVDPKFMGSPREVVRCLLTYTDWWQPPTTAIIQVGAARRNGDTYTGFHSGLLETLDERTELCRRMSYLPERDRELLFLWYVKQASPSEIARIVGLSPRQCFRRRGRAIRRIVELDDPQNQHEAV